MSRDFKNGIAVDRWWSKSVFRGRLHSINNGGGFDKNSPSLVWWPAARTPHALHTAVGNRLLVVAQSLRSRNAVVPHLHRTIRKAFSAHPAATIREPFTSYNPNYLHD